MPAECTMRIPSRVPASAAISRLSTSLRGGVNEEVFLFRSRNRFVRWIGGPASSAVGSHVLALRHLLWLCAVRYSPATQRDRSQSLPLGCRQIRRSQCAL